MMKSRRTRPVCLLFLAGLGAHGCVPSRPPDPVMVETSRICGVESAMRPGNPARWRERPPACALPTEQEVALSCAIHDRISAPGYVPPDCDEGTGRCNPQERPLPTYRVNNLDCRYTNRDQSAATCAFMLAAPDDDGPGRQVEVPFEHLFWADHGPAHHIYGTRWSLDYRADCTPGSAAE